MAFADEATPGLRCEQFTGSATAVPQTASFRVQTAALTQH
jgi:hypothetical protein